MLAFLEQCVDLLNMLIQLLVFVRWQSLLEVGDPCFDGGHTRRWLLSTLFDNIEGLLKQAFILLLLVHALGATTFRRWIFGSIGSIR